MRQVANQSNEALIMRFLVDGGSSDGSGCRVSMVGEVSIPMINNHSSFVLMRELRKHDQQSDAMRERT